MKTIASLMALGCALVAVPSIAQDGEPTSAAASIDVWASSDADDTAVVRTGINLDWVHESDANYQGIRVEKAWFTPLGGTTTEFERVYARYADKSGQWVWNAQVGTDGHTVLGSINVADTSRWRKELFVERDIIETPRGVTEGIYFTFAGAALDLPLGERDTATLVAGVQEFTGRNVRLHVRANYVHLIQEDWGLTAQVRGRYFHSTTPGEYDYFSPRWYAEVLPVLQLRRFDNGWRYLVAAGFGAQRDSSSSWRSSRYVNVQATSPATRPVQLRASLLYSNTPVGSGYVYDYLQGSLAVMTRF